MNLPAQYGWLLQLSPLPRMVQEALKLYGTRELVGSKHNPTILDWARELEIDHIYREDEMPWCGLFVGICAHRADKVVTLTSYDLLRALQWVRFGRPTPVPMLGDVLVFRRKGGGHVGLYIAEDETCYHVLGGNQGNQVSIMRMEKDRLQAVRRPLYNNQPLTVRPYRVAPTGIISKNEA